MGISISIMNMYKIVDVREFERNFFFNIEAWCNILIIERRKKLKILTNHDKLVVVDDSMEYIDWVVDFLFLFLFFGQSSESTILIAN